MEFQRNKLDDNKKTIKNQNNSITGLPQIQII